MQYFDVTINLILGPLLVQFVLEQKFGFNLGLLLKAEVFLQLEWTENNLWSFSPLKQQLKMF